MIYHSKGNDKDMVYHPLSGFEEFQNTTEGKKVQGYRSSKTKEPVLKFRKIKYKDRIDVVVIFNEALLRQMKDNKVIDFKILFNEETKQVAIKYDNSSGKKTLVGKSTRPNGDIYMSDKFITATMLPLLKDDTCISYKLKNVLDKIIFIFNRF